MKQRCPTCGNEMRRVLTYIEYDYLYWTCPIDGTSVQVERRWGCPKDMEEKEIKAVNSTPLVPVAVKNFFARWRGTSIRKRKQKQGSNR